jgi:rod shape-determining protein MreD
MTRHIATFLVITLAIILQVSVLPVHFASPFKPDLLLIAMVFMALRGPFETGAPLAWFLGLLKDVFSGLYLGLNAFTFLIIFVVIKSVSDRLYAESSELFVVTVSIASLACVVADLLLLVMFTSTPSISYSMTSGLIPYLLVNAFVASLVTLLPIFSSPQETV